MNINRLSGNFSGTFPAFSRSYFHALLNNDRPNIQVICQGITHFNEILPNPYICRRMSIVHNILPKSKFSFTDLNATIAKFPFDVKFHRRDDSLYFYWIPAKSARGVDVSHEDGFIEIRNTILSNSDDYELTNLLVEQILMLTQGKIYNEDKEIVLKMPLFSIAVIEELINNDCEAIFFFVNKGEDLTISGPDRDVHFGKKVLKKHNLLNSGEFKKQIHDIILEVNYKLPDYEQGMVMQMKNGRSGKTEILKLITNTVDLIIGKYDYIVFAGEPKKPLMITNSILNNILPCEWSLVDEYTIVAPILSTPSWNKLLDAVRINDVTDKVV